MRIPALTTTFAVALALAACGGNNDADSNAVTTDANMTDDVAVNDVLGADNMVNPAGAAMTANDFATTVAGSDMYEVQSGQLAETAGSSADVKAFGKQLVTDHGKSSAMLKAAAAKASPPMTLPAALPADLQAKLDALKAAKGADFDRLFIDQQTEGHQKALDALRNYAAGGDSQPLKEFAGTAVPGVQMHLDKLNGMKH